jgi:gluconate 2-dehydrogenase gamma chain
MADDQPRVITRRDLLRGAAVLGAAAAAGPVELISGAADAAAVAPAAQPAPAARVGFEHLTAAESDILEAIVARLIPTDALGPGATEARAARYIDRALGGALSASREAYRVGLAALDRYAAMTRGKPFVELSPTYQDSVLIDVETGAATGAGAGFSGSSAQFFGLVKGHTWQGTFGDPYYGGNANFVGWDLLNYPGVRTAVSASDQQQLEKGALKPVRRSAYDTDMFNKATASVDHDGGRHAD